MVLLYNGETNDEWENLKKAVSKMNIYNSGDNE